MIEMHDVIVDILRGDHQVADQLGIGWYWVIQGIFNRPYRRDAVYQRANTADALCKGPGIPRIPSPEDDLDAAYHGAGRIGLRNAVSIHLGFNAQVAFDACDRVNDNSFAHFLFLCQMFGNGFCQAE